MEPNGRNESVPEGLLQAVADANHETYTKQGTPDKATKDPAATGATGAQGGVTPLKKQKTNTETDIDEAEEEAPGDNAEGLDEQDFSRQPVPSIAEADEDEATTTEPSQTNTETQPEADFDWKSTLPPDPGEFKQEPPKPDDFGQIDPLDYSDYLEAKILHRQKSEAYNDKVITATFDAVEKILPEVKDDPAFQQAIRSTFQSTLSSDQTVQMAKDLRASIDRVAASNKAAGVTSAKTSITIQKNAAVETKGATQKKAPPSKGDNLAKRLAKNDTSAFEELMNDWQSNKKV